ncbi:MAG: nuclease A inhibitor family protein [Myxococcota bacterium]
MTRVCWVAVLLSGCVEPKSALEGEDLALRSGTPEAIAVLAMLRDPVVSFDVLDVDAGLDARAARGLIARRDGPDAVYGTPDDRPFESIEEVDAVPYVGPAALNQLADFAKAGGWLEEGPQVVEGVAFTPDQARATLELANTASLETLDVAVGLDSRAAAGIVERRPFADLVALGAVPYVGPSALIALRDHASAGAVSSDDALATLEANTPGLWFTSETDAPLVVVHLPGGAATPVTAADAAARLAALADPTLPALSGLAVEERTVASVFARYTEPQPWWEPFQLDEQPAWSAIRAVFEDDLADGRVFRFGEPTWDGTSVGGLIQVFVIGTSAEGDLVGVRTIAVET